MSCEIGRQDRSFVQLIKQKAKSPMKMSGTDPRTCYIALQFVCRKCISHVREMWSDVSPTSDLNAEPHKQDEVGTKTASESVVHIV